jgi:biotin carboxylase
MHHIVIIASEYKGIEFIEEAHNAGWYTTLITRRSLLKEAWPWEAISDTKTVDDDAGVMDYIRTTTNIAGTRLIDRVVGLDEFDVLTAAMTREHLNLPGMSRSHALRFRDKLTMRTIAQNAGIPCPEFVGAFNMDEINRFVAEVPSPWIVKPRHEVSAFGIRKCETADEVWHVLNELDHRNNWRDHPSQFLIERFVEGRVFHVDSVVNEGKVVCAGVSQYGTTPYKVSHHGGVYTSSTVDYRSSERKQLETLNRALLMAFNLQCGVSHAEFLQSEVTGEFFLLEVACRVGGAYTANVLEEASNFNLWREWARLETATPERPYKAPKTRKEFAGITLALARMSAPDTSSYTDEEIVYRVKKPNHVGLIFRAKKRQRIEELLDTYTSRITDDFLAVAPVKERHDDGAVDAEARIH